jgi:hypothetical protein
MAFAVGGASAQRAKLERIEVLRSGLYSGSIGRQESSPGSPTGKAAMIDSPSFYVDEARVPAQIGIRFGFEYRVLGSPTGREVRLRGVWHIPAPGITNPTNGNTYRESARDFTVRIGDTHVHGYGFDQPWEIVEGDWVLEIWQGETALASRTFSVKAP